jgi:putative membrane protein
MSMTTTNNQKKFNNIIIAVSIAIPLVVVVLFNVKLPNVAPLNFLPPVYATINGLTAVLLIAALVAIKNGKRQVHQRLMQLALVCSVLFLGMYVAYHMTSESTPYGGEGMLRFVYFFILISHILLSIAVIPLVLFTYLRAWNQDFEGHKKLARITFPIWLYVAVTGVVVYLMIAPFYS